MRVLVAMSGGVDSSVAALLMQQQKHEVIGVNFLLSADAVVDPSLEECCRALKIPLIVRECGDAFYQRVLVDSAREYARGRTPNPCCRCNAELKFKELFAAADELGIEHVVTGHYARTQIRDGVAGIIPAADRNKDQGYFLYRLTQEQLQRVVFPLGGYSKSDVRQIAGEHGLICAARPDSQDACFQVPGECCGDTLSRLCRISGKRGRFIYQGKNVGRHDGIHRFTIGQRQGLGVALGVPAYIRQIDAERGDIFLCTDQQELLCDRFKVDNIVWQQGGVPAPDVELGVRVRYRSGIKTCFFSGDENSGVVCLTEAQRAVTPGQAAVFYDSEGTILGGGVISLLPEDATGSGRSENSQPQ